MSFGAAPHRVLEPSSLEYVEHPRAHHNFSVTINSPIHNSMHLAYCLLCGALGTHLQQRIYLGASLMLARTRILPASPAPSPCGTELSMLHRALICGTALHLVASEFTESFETSTV